MPTRGEIGVLLENGAVVSRYRHTDAYIRGLGTDIYWELDDTEYIEATVFGALEDRLINYYNDDCLYDLDESADFFTYPNVKSYLESVDITDREYIYLWAKGHWWVAVTKGNWPYEDYLKDLEFKEQKFFKLEDNDVEVFLNPDITLKLNDKGDIVEDES